jgi:hypothetical protein
LSERSFLAQVPLMPAFASFVVKALDIVLAALIFTALT